MKRWVLDKLFSWLEGTDRNYWRKAIIEEWPSLRARYAKPVGVDPTTGDIIWDIDKYQGELIIEGFLKIGKNND